MSGLRRGYKFWQITGPLSFEDFRQLQLSPEFWCDLFSQLETGTQSRIEDLRLIRRILAPEGPLTSEEVIESSAAIARNPEIVRQVLDTPQEQDKPNG